MAETDNRSRFFLSDAGAHTIWPEPELAPGPLRSRPKKWWLHNTGRFTQVFYYYRAWIIDQFLISTGTQNYRPPGQICCRVGHRRQVCRLGIRFDTRGRLAWVGWRAGEEGEGRPYRRPGSSMPTSWLAHPAEFWIQDWQGVISNFFLLLCRVIAFLSLGFLIETICSKYRR